MAKGEENSFAKVIFIIKVFNGYLNGEGCEYKPKYEKRKRQYTRTPAVPTGRCRGLPHPAAEAQCLYAGFANDGSVLPNSDTFRERTQQYLIKTLPPYLK